MASKGNSIKRDFIKSTDTLKGSEVDVLSTVDMGFDNVKAGETTNKAVASSHKQVNK